MSLQAFFHHCVIAQQGKKLIHQVDKNGGFRVHQVNAFK